MRKKMMVMPLLFLVLMAVPMVASEGNETDVIILPPPPLPITNETDPVIIVTDQGLASIQLQLDNIYAWMIGHDTVMMGTRNMVREINGTLNIQITDIIDSLNTALDDIWANNVYLESEIDFQRTLIDELRHEVWLLNQELEAERAMRNNITIMFGVFCLVVIGATVVINKK